LLAYLCSDLSPWLAGFPFAGGFDGFSLKRTEFTIDFGSTQLFALTRIRLFALAEILFFAFMMIQLFIV
jgi:hypothetical protein